MQSGDLLLDHLYRRAGFGANAADLQAVAGMSYAAAVDYFVVAQHAEEPAYSPDGSRIAFVSYRDRNVDPEGDFDGPALASELYVENVDGSGLARVTHTHDAQENAPSWDPSGERLAYTKTTGTTGNDWFGLGLTNVVMEINADGTCPARVFGKPAKPDSRKLVGLYDPVWQPGPGRAAGRIECAG